jgi:hypothetical protein
MTPRIRHDAAAEGRDQKIAWFLSLSVTERLAHADGVMRLLRAAGTLTSNPEEEHADRVARVVRLPGGA